MSFYKGLGGITGCCVAGERDVIDEVAIWRTRHGGRLYGLWPYAASARTVLAERLPRMRAYYRHARAIGDSLCELSGVHELPTRVQTSMMHLRLAVSLEDLRSRALAIAQAQGVWTFARPFAFEGESSQRVEFTVGDATMKFTPDEVRHYVQRFVKAPRRTTTKAAVRSGRVSTGRGR